MINFELSSVLPHVFSISVRRITFTQLLKPDTHVLILDFSLSFIIHVCPSIYPSQDLSVITLRFLLSDVLFSSSEVITLGQAIISLTIAVKSLLKAFLSCPPQIYSPLSKQTG